MPFNPRYTITDKIINDLTLITSGREVIEQARLIPQWEARLYRQALMRNTHSSTAIEGNKLSLEQVESVSSGKDVVGTTKDKKEVLNYLKALESIPDLAKTDTITARMMLEIQKTITKDTLEDPSDSGAFRRKQVYVGKRVFDGTTYKVEVEYTPPGAKEVPGLVDNFIKWLAAEETHNIHPVLLAGIAHYEIARIHPFIDGNGRTSRLVATLILYKTGFDHRRIFALDDYYDRDRQAYYAALKAVQKSGGDLTLWLEYFTGGVAASVDEVRKAVGKLGHAGKPAGAKPIHLTQKQTAIIEHIAVHGRVTNRDMQQIFKISAQAVHKEFTKLVELNIIKTVGQGRSLYYVLDE